MFHHNVTTYCNVPALIDAHAFFLQLTMDVNTVLARSGIKRTVLVQAPTYLSEYQPDGNPRGNHLFSGSFEIGLIIQNRQGTSWMSPSATGGFDIIVSLDKSQFSASEYYERLLYTFLHEFGHGFGLGFSEYYSHNIVPPDENNEYDEGVNSLEYFQCNYWASRIGLYHDPLRANVGPYRYAPWHARFICSGLLRLELRTGAKLTLTNWIPTPWYYEIGLKDANVFQRIALPPGPVEINIPFVSNRNIIRVVCPESKDHFGWVQYISVFDALFSHFVFVPIEKARTEIRLYIEEYCGYLQILTETPFEQTVLEASYNNGKDWSPINAWVKPGTWTTAHPKTSNAIFRAKVLNTDLSTYVIA